MASDDHLTMPDAVMGVAVLAFIAFFMWLLFRD